MRDEIAIFSPVEKIETAGRKLLADKLWECEYGKKIPYIVRELAVMLATISTKKGVSSAEMGEAAAIVLDFDQLPEPPVDIPDDVTDDKDAIKDGRKKRKKRRDYVPSPHRTALQWAHYGVALGVFSYGPDEDCRTRKIFVFDAGQKEKFLRVAGGKPIIDEIIAKQKADPSNLSAGRTAENEPFYAHILKRKEK